MTILNEDDDARSAWPGVVGARLKEVRPYVFIPIGVGLGGYLSLYCAWRMYLFTVW